MTMTLRTGARYPLWFEDIPDYVDISAADFSPIEDGALEDTEIEVYTKSGFGVKNATEDAGYIYAVTWHQYEANRRDLTGIVPRQIYLLGGDWALTPLVKVFAGDDDEYASTVTTINVGTIR